MTKRQAINAASIALLTLAVVSGGLSGTFNRVLGARVMIDRSAQLSGGAPQQGGETKPAPALEASGVAASTAKVLTSVSVAEARTEANGYAIEARIVGRDGRAAPDVEVAFYDVLPLLGPREMLIGTAKTDGFGIASLNYLPAQGGTHTINVRPTQWDRIAATQATATIAATRVAPVTYARERLPLDPFSVRLPSIGALLVLAIWGLFALIVLGTAYLIPRGARRSPYMGKAREV